MAVATVARFTFRTFRADFRAGCRVNWPTRWVLVCSGALHISIGLADFLFPPASVFHYASAWQVLFQFLDRAVWNVCFLIVGLLALVGLGSRRTAQLSFVASAVLFGAWAVFSGWAWYAGLGATLAGTLALAYLSILQLGIAAYILRLERYHVGTSRLARKLDEVERAVPNDSPEPTSDAG